MCGVCVLFGCFGFLVCCTKGGKCVNLMPGSIKGVCLRKENMVCISALQKWLKRRWNKLRMWTVKVLYFLLDVFAVFQTICTVSFLTLDIQFLHTDDRLPSWKTHSERTCHQVKLDISLCRQNRFTHDGRVWMGAAISEEKQQESVDWFHFRKDTASAFQKVFYSGCGDPCQTVKM